MHDINMTDKYGMSIKDSLEKHNYIYIKELKKFIPNVKTTNSFGKC